MREWFKELPAYERQAIGENIKAVQFCCPLGRPQGRKWAGKVCEIQTQLPARIAGILFAVKGKHIVRHMDLSKRQATPAQEIELALTRIDF